MDPLRLAVRRRRIARMGHRREDEYDTSHPNHGGLRENLFKDMRIAVDRSTRSPAGVKASKKAYLHQAARAAYANYEKKGTKEAWDRVVRIHNKRGLGGGQLTKEAAYRMYD